jgi:hypothetical protein
MCGQKQDPPMAVGERVLEKKKRRLEIEKQNGMGVNKRVES